MRFKRPLTLVAKKARRGDRGFPLATVVYHGPDDTRASKVAVGIILAEGERAAALERYYSETADARHDPVVQRAIEALFKKFQVRSVVSPSAIVGCPHEEGIEYPDGEDCPHCPFWKGRDRFAHIPELRPARARELAEWAWENADALERAACPAGGGPERKGH